MTSEFYIIQGGRTSGWVTIEFFRRLWKGSVEKGVIPLACFVASMRQRYLFSVHCERKWLQCYNFLWISPHYQHAKLPCRLPPIRIGPARSTTMIGDRFHRWQMIYLDYVCINIGFHPAIVLQNETYDADALRKCWLQRNCFPRGSLSWWLCSVRLFFENRSGPLQVSR